MAVTILGRKAASTSSATAATLTIILKSAKTDTELDVLAALSSGGYNYGQPHPTLIWLYAENPEIERESDKKWVATVNYVLPEKPNQYDELLPEVNFDWEDRNVPMEKDLDGTACLTSAGEPYDPPIEREECTGVIVVRRPEASIDLDFIHTLQNSINSSPVTIGSATTGNITVATKKGKLKIRLSEEKTYQANATSQVIYRTVEYRISIGEIWQAEPLDRGTYYKSGSNLLRTTALGGEPIMTLLNGSGGKLAVGGTPVYNNFKRCREENWTSLGFPTV